MTDKFDGKKGSGRQRTSYLTSLKKWLVPTANENTITQASATRETARDRQLTTTTNGKTDRLTGMQNPRCALGLLGLLNDIKQEAQLSLG